MKHSPFKIAVVGAGLIGKKHIELVQNLAQLHCLIDPDPTAKALAEASGALWFADLQDYLNTHRPDGVIIATPNTLHAPQGLAVIAAGIPVLIEKPLAHSVNAARDLNRAAKAQNVPLLVGHHRRHSPLIKAAKRAIEDGTFGRIVTLSAQFWLYKPEDYFDVTWRKLAGGGPTLINLIHDIDLMRHFCGDIKRVQAVESHQERGFEVEDTSAVILEFTSGTLGTVSISDSVVAPWSWELTAGENPVYPKTDMSCYMLGGNKASLSIPDLTVWRHPGKRSWWNLIEPRKLPYQPADPVQEQLAHFLDVIAGQATPLVTGADGLQNLQVLEAIKVAADQGTAQDIDLKGKQDAF